MLAITVGGPKNNAHGKLIDITPPPVEGLRLVLVKQPALLERWWSPHRWQKNHRKTEHWISSCAATVDADFCDKETYPAPRDRQELVLDLARSGKLPGNLFYQTPHGLRVVFVYPDECSEPELVAKSEHGAGVLVMRALAEAGLTDYRVDEPLLGERARFFYTPNAIAKNVERHADVLEMRPGPYDPLELAGIAAAAPVVTKPALAVVPDQEFKDAVKRYNAAHSLELPRDSGTCPICKHDGCFGRMPDDDQRWCCFSTDHPQGVGVQGPNFHHGDALDIEAHAAGRSRKQILQATGYLVPKKREPRGVVATDPQARPLRNRSYLTAVTILEGNAKNVLHGSVLELNEMTGRVELGREPIDDTHVSAARARIELLFQGGEDKNGNPTGLTLSKADVCDAVDQVAAGRRYHPVRDYLSGLAWDGTKRLDHVVEDVLSAERSAINVRLVRCFFLSAVARVYTPGCKVDTVLVLVGKQGCGKSSFFRILGEPWFVDTAVDIHDKDAFQVLRRAWIYEWAELEVLRRAKDAAAAKAFLSSQIDTYRPSYGRKVVDVLRSGIIVGSTNNPEFLTDDTGNRRFWPLEVGEVDLELLRQWKDQLWAEARTAAEGGEPYWLSREEGRALSTLQEQHLVRDAWESVVLSYAEARVIPLTIPDILANAIGKPRGQWTKTDEMRVSSILKRAGYARGRRAGRGGSPTWSKARS